MKKTKTSVSPSSFLALACCISLVGFISACPSSVENPTPEENAQEVITAVELTFTPAGGGNAFMALWQDPENDGSPVVDDIVLADGEEYTLDIRFLNQLQDPVEDITEEVAAESDQHQIFIYGSAVSGPASNMNAAVVTHAYNDEDSAQLPIGLTNTLTSAQLGDGVLSIMLRHLPPQNGVEVKTDSLAQDFAEGGTNAIAGEVDANVDFALTVE